MKVLIVPDKFKGSISAQEVADAVEKGIFKANSRADIIKIPLADGGEGTSVLLGMYFKAKMIRLVVHDPLMREVAGRYYFSSVRKEAYIEMAVASGLGLLSEKERNPLDTTAYGTGEMIDDALKRGAEHVILCIGGSATNDMGIGMADALGYRFLNSEGERIKPVGRSLNEIKNYYPPEINAMAKVRFTVLTDVSSPLYGKNGAAYVYGPQKGADENACKKLDKGLRSFSRLIYAKTGHDLNKMKGAGAAGGLGAGAMAFLNAKLMNGADYIIELMDIPRQIEKADWVITGEGKLDHQTLEGKLIERICSVARIKNKKIIGICGKNTLSESDLRNMGITKVLDLQSIEPNLDKSIEYAALLITGIVKHWALNTLQ